MNRRITVLCALLVLQILAALGMNLQPGVASAQSHKALLAFSAADVDRIEIAGKDHVVRLQRHAGAWRLPAYHDLPASDDGVRLLLDRLGRLEGGVPIATAPDDRKRFKVAASDFQRRIKLWHGKDELATVFIGTSAARNRSRLRVKGDPDIYEEPIAKYELGDEPGSWVDKHLLHLPEAAITAIKANGWVLKRQGESSSRVSAPEGEWHATGLPAASALDQAVASRLAGLLAQLDFDAVLDTDGKHDYGLDKPLLSLTLLHGTLQRQYRIGKIAGMNAYALKVSDHKEIFRLQSYQINPLIEAAKAAALTQQKGEKARH